MTKEENLILRLMIIKLYLMESINKDIDIATDGYIPRLDPKVLTDVFEYSIVEFPPQPIDTLKHVWLFHLMLGEEDMMDVHIVQTDTSKQE